MKVFVLMAVFCGTAVGQISYGLIGGAPFGKLTTGTAGLVDTSGSFTIGPTLQIGLPFGFRIEADALYRGAGLQYPSLATINKFSAAQWRFPILAQYRFAGPPLVKPYVEAGFSYDHLTIHAAAPYAIAPHRGFVIGAGVDFKVPLVRISPELRYTRDVGSSDKALQTNQAEFLVGVRF